MGLSVAPRTLKPQPIPGRNLGPSELAAPTAARIRCRFLRRIRNFTANTYISCMNKILSPEQTARLERQRLAAEDGAKALQEVAERSVAVRENMARLRALRLAKEAVRTQIATENQRPNSRRDRR